MNGQDKAKALGRLKQVLQRAPQVMAAGRNSHDFEKWRSDAITATRRAFGEESEELSDFKKISFLPMAVSIRGGTDWETPFRNGVKRAKAKLESMIEDLEYWEGEPEVPEVTPRIPFNEPSGKSQNSTKVFLIHGHDEAAREAVARYLEQLGLDPVILAERPSGGRTIIEKVEAHADVGYAIALLTPDDVGSRQEDDAVQPRARQNVIFELGYFIGRLGRERVCALTKGQPEIPSDYSGVVYIPMASNAWKMALIKELKAAGLHVDANKAFP